MQKEIGKPLFPTSPLFFPLETTELSWGRWGGAGFPLLGRALTSPPLPPGSDIQNQVEVPSGASKAAEGRQRKFQVPSLMPSQEPCHPTFFSGVSQTDVRWVGLWLSGSRVVSYVLTQQQGLWKLMVLPKFTQSPRALGCSSYVNLSPLLCVP